MFFSVEAITLVVRVMQMFGIALGTGAQSVMLIAYVQAARDGIIDSAEAQFARAVRWIMRFGLLLIVLSGVASIVLDATQNNASVFFAPAYLFKWALIGAVVLLSFMPVRWLLVEGLAEGLAGGSWYVLFLVHILAPVASWTNLLTLYAVWMVGFGICWAVVIGTTHQKKRGVESPPKIIPVSKPVAPAPTPAQNFPFAPKPAAAAPPTPPKATPVVASPPLPSVALAKEGTKPIAPAPPLMMPAEPVPQQAHILQTLPQPDTAPKAAPTMAEKEHNPWLPAIQIMPQTPGDAQKQAPPAPTPSPVEPK